MIEVQDLVKSYGSTQAVRQMSFTVESQRVCGLLGVNGAGKTTLMRLLTGYIYPDSGSVKIEGIDMSLRPIDARACIGYVPENAPLYPELTAFELLDFVAGARASRRPVGRNARRGKIGKNAMQELLERVGVAEVAQRRIGSLSRGFRQRVALAAALLDSPQVLILDEPTSALDPNQVRDMRELIRDLGKERTVLVSSHILSEVEAVCKEALILHEGKIVARGEIGQLRAENTVGVASRVRVGFDRPFDEDIRRLLMAEPWVADCNPQRDDLRDANFGIVTLRADAAGPECIFEFAVRHSVKLRRLEQLDTDLEDVFQALTLGTEHLS